MDYEIYLALISALFGLPIAIVLFVRACRNLEQLMPEEVVALARRALASEVNTRSVLDIMD